MTRTLITLLVALLPASVFANNSTSDLCADVRIGPDGSPITDSYGQTISRFCELTGPTPPVWAADVCCTFGSADDARCKPPTARGCSVGATMWCEYGEMTGAEVTCYQPFQDTCEAGFCDVATPTPDVTADLLCCYGTNICYEWGDNWESCEGMLSFCLAGESHPDGSTTCHDYE